MKDLVVNKLMNKIKNTKKYSNTKLIEIKYGLDGLYSLITKMTVITILSIFLHIFKEYIIFLIFYIPLRSFGFGVHAKSNLSCWIYSTMSLLMLPWIFNIIKLSSLIKIVLWVMCLISFILFCPAQTSKRPIRSISYKRSLKIKIVVISFIYLPIIIYFKSVSNLVIAAMLLQTFLSCPLSYILMGQKIMFSINDIYLYKNRKEV